MKMMLKWEKGRDEIHRDDERKQMITKVVTFWIKIWKSLSINIQKVVINFTEWGEKKKKTYENLLEAFNNYENKYSNDDDRGIQSRWFKVRC